MGTFNTNLLFWLLISFGIVIFILILVVVYLIVKYKKIKINPYIQNITKHREQKIDKELVKYRNQQLLILEDEIQKNKLLYLKKIILETMQSYHLKIINESSVHYIEIDDKIKPLMIGKKGRNIKYLSELSGCNVNINKTDPYIEISCPNPFDRSIAINTINHMIKSEAFDINAIKNIYDKEKKLILSDCIACGKKYLSMLNIENKNDELCNYVGRLKYRWSFSQNVLQHCYETALICEKLAQKFGLNSQLSKEVGFFHDIGKSIDYKQTYDHVTSGIDIAKKCHLKQTIIDVIANHHKTKCDNDYVLLAKCADAWSAARVGARHTVENNDNQLLQIVKSKLNSITGIEKYIVEINDKNISIIFSPKNNTIEKRKILKYDIFQVLKKDVRLKKYTIRLIC